MGDSQQIKDSPNTRKGAVLIANPLKILKVDPIYGGVDPNSADSIPTRGYYLSDRKLRDSPEDTEKRENFYNQIQFTFTASVLWGFGLGYLLPRVYHLQRTVRIAALAVAGVVVYPIYAIAGPGTERQAFTQIYPSNTQLLKYSMQQLQEKYSLTRAWSWLTNRNYMSTPSPVYNTKKGVVNGEIAETWFGLRIRDKVELATQQKLHPVSFPKEPMQFNPTDFFNYYRRKFFEKLESHPMQISIAEAKRTASLNGKQLKFADYYQIFNDYFIGPRRYFLRFMGYKYWHRHLRLDRKYQGRYWPLLMVQLSFILWIVPRPFREMSVKIQAYSYLLAAYVTYKSWQKFLPERRDAEWLRRNPEPKPPLTYRIKKGIFYTVVFLFLGELMEKWIYMVEQGAHVDYSDFESSDSDFAGLEELTDTAGSIFGHFSEKIKALKETAAINRQRLRDKTSIPLQLDLERTVDKRNLFPLEGAPEGKVRPIENILVLKENGEVEKVKLTANALYEMELANIFFDGDKVKLHQFEDFMEKSQALTPEQEKEKRRKLKEEVQKSVGFVVEEKSNVLPGDMPVGDSLKSQQNRS